MSKGVRMRVVLSVTNETATKEELEELERLRPKTRGECEDGAEDRLAGRDACPFFACKYNSYLDLNGSQISTHPNDITELGTSNCVLDFEGGASEDATAKAFGVCHQAISLTINRARAHVRRPYVRKLVDWEPSDEKPGMADFAALYGF